MILTPSKQITQSQVLGTLDLSILEKALQKTRQQNHSQVGTWLLDFLQKSGKRQKAKGTH